MFLSPTNGVEGRGLSVTLDVHLSILIFSFPEQILETYVGIYFTLHTHTHPLMGVDVPFGGYDL